MKKIACLFEIDHTAHKAVNVMNHKASFLFANPDAVATVKRDGTATKFTTDGVWLARRAVKPGKNAPAGFIAEETDPNTGTTFGWEPIEASGFAKFHKKALDNIDFTPEPGTFELCGPKIGGNPENLDKDWLFVHGSETPGDDFPSVGEIAEHTDDLMGFLRPWFEGFRADGVEGVVWWVDGAPAVKARVKDFFPEDDLR